MTRYRLIPLALAAVLLLLASSGCANVINAYSIPRLRVSPYPSTCADSADPLCGYQSPAWCDPYSAGRSVGAPGEGP